MSLTITKFLRYTGLSKPWFYLGICSYVIMWLLVWSGNPLLPIQFLENGGWAWHHIPEISTFSFLGMWFGSLGFLPSDKFNYFDAIPLVMLTIISVYELASFFIIFWVVLIVVSIPSFCGYFAIRWNKIHQTRKEAYKLLGIEQSST